MASQFGRPHCFNFSVGLSNRIAIITPTNKGSKSPEPMYKIATTPPTMRNVLIR
jgi:hypothetical protein